MSQMDIHASAEACLAGIIRRHRVKRGFNQAQLATAIGVQQSAVSKWERGDTKPAATIFPKLAKALRVDVSFLSNAAAGVAVKS